MSGAPAYHGWTHRPKAEGGTDPIPVAASDLKWATATMFSTATAKSTSWYYASFDQLGTNDTDVFTLEDASGGKAPWLGINAGGLYHCWFGVITAGASASSAWGVNYAALEPIFEEGGSPTILNSETDVGADFEEAFYNRANEQYAAEQPASAPRHRGMFNFMALHYDPPSPDVGNFGFEVPFKLGVRMLTDQTGSVTFTAQIHVVQVAATAGYTLVEA